MRSLFVVSTALFVGLLIVVALVGPVSTTGLTPRPAQAAPAVRVFVNCDSNPETTLVKNRTNHRIRIRTIGSIYKPRTDELFNIREELGLAKALLGAGKARIFETGPAANTNVLTNAYIYNSSVGSKEGARVRTSVGRFIDRC